MAVYHCSVLILCLIMRASLMQLIVQEVSLTHEHRLMSMHWGVTFAGSDKFSGLVQLQGAFVLSVIPF